MAENRVSGRAPCSALDELWEKTKVNVKMMVTPRSQKAKQATMKLQVKKENVAIGKTSGSGQIKF